MYLSFYELKKKPFQLNTNSSFVWLGKMHNDALALLKYGVLENHGFLLLTGDVGTGKTTLVNTLINDLGDEIIVAKVPDPGMEILDFMNYISAALEMNRTFVNKEAFLIHFDRFLKGVGSVGKKVLLVIDECQRLSTGQLEEIRQLSNIEYLEKKILNILLIGQEGFNATLREESNSALAQRIVINYRVEPLTADETRAFINHRLTISGAKNEIFSPEIIKKIYNYSKGIPRRINIICDHLLLSGFTRKTRIITAEMVTSCVNDLSLPSASVSDTLNHLQSVDNFGGKKSKKKKNEFAGTAEQVPEVEIAKAAVVRGRITVGAVILGILVITSIYYVDSFKPVKALYQLTLESGVQILASLQQPISQEPVTKELKDVSPEDSSKSSTKSDMVPDSQALIVEKPHLIIPSSGQLPIGDGLIDSKRIEVRAVAVEGLVESVPTVQATGGLSAKTVSNLDSLLAEPKPSKTSEEITERSVENAADLPGEGAELEVAAIVENPSDALPVIKKENEDSDTITTIPAEANRQGTEELSLPESDAQGYSRPEEFLTAGNLRKAAEPARQTSLTLQITGDDEERGGEPEDIDPGAIIDWLIKTRSQ